MSWRRDFDAARDPYTARNALGILPTVAGAPIGAQYITAAADPTLTNERLLTNTATITWDFSTAGQAKASTVGGGGNVSNSGTPTAGQYGKWVTATTIQGVAPATVLSDIGAQPAGSYQPLDADLTALAAASAINAIYYRSAANTWATITIGTGLTFTGGTLAATAGAPVGAEYITSTADATLTAERVLTDTATVTWDRTTAGQIKANAVSSGGTPGPPQGRLTLQTGVPVMTTTTANAQTLYYTPYIGNSIPLYNGTSFAMTTFAELSALSTDTTKSPAAIGALKVNDWFVWNDAGTIRLGHGPDWTNTTTRSAGTALVRVNGLWLNSVSITNGAAAQRGTYVGTTYSWTDASFCWIYGVVAVGGGQSLLMIWNAYNRVNVSTMIGDSSATWTYAGTAVRMSNNSSGMRVYAVLGLAEDTVEAAFHCPAAGVDAAINAAVGVGIDTTAAFSGQWGFVQPSQPTVAVGRVQLVTIGARFFQALEYSGGATSTFWGGGAAFYQNGLFFNARM